MNILSISYKKTPQEVREKFAFSPDQQRSFFQQVTTVPGVTQCVILSTCNRCEIYFDGGSRTVQPVEVLLCRNKGVSLKETLPILYVYEGAGAIRHLTRVAAGMDSMILGEDEILRQLKEAYQTALDAKMTSFEFNTIFQMAIAAAKNIKTDTGLSTTPVSYGTLAANEVFHWPGKEKLVLIIGASGKIGSITAKNIAGHPGITLYGTLHSKHGGKKITEVPAEMTMIPFPDRYSLMDRADVIISATSSPHYTVTEEELEPVLQTGKERLFLDLAVPADIDSSIAELDGITLRNIDWFRETAERNTAIKQHEAVVAGESAEYYADEIQKELSLHHLISELPELKETVDKNGFDNLIFSLRSLASRSQVEAVSKWLDDFMKERSS